MGTEAIVAAYNEFRSQVVLLQEMKTTLQNAEFELETLRNRLIEEGKQVFPVVFVCFFVSLRRSGDVCLSCLVVLA